MKAFALFFKHPLQALNYQYYKINFDEKKYF